MRRFLTVLALVGMAFVLIAGPVLAAGSGRDSVVAQQKTVWPKYHIISFTGTITSIPAANKFYVQIQITNNPYIAKRGTVELVTTTSSTVYVVWSGTTPTTLSSSTGFSTLDVGDSVSINALATTSITTARRVEVNKPRY